MTDAAPDILDLHALSQPDKVALISDPPGAFARQHLAGYKAPRSVSFMAEPPRTGSGKILKRQLREPYWAGRTSRVS